MYLTYSFIVITSIISQLTFNLHVSLTPAPFSYNFVFYPPFSRTLLLKLRQLILSDGSLEDQFHDSSPTRKVKFFLAQKVKLYLTQFSILVMLILLWRCSRSDKPLERILERKPRRPFLTPRIRLCEDWKKSRYDPRDGLRCCLELFSRQRARSYQLVCQRFFMLTA